MLQTYDEVQVEITIVIKHSFIEMNYIKTKDGTFKESLVQLSQWMEDGYVCRKMKYGGIYFYKEALVWISK